MTTVTFSNSFCTSLAFFNRGYRSYSTEIKFVITKKPSKDMNIKYVDLAEAEGEAPVNEKTLQ